MRYISNDGKIFENENSCKEYENELLKKQSSKEKELENIKHDYHELFKKIDTYEKAYDEKIMLGVLGNNPWTELFRRLL